MTQNGDRDRVLVSYLTLRRLLGILGVSLPIILAIGCLVIGSCAMIQDSISDYYGTVMRDVFVGALFAIGWFLLSYRGYDNRDNFVGDLAWFFAMGVALFPTTAVSQWTRALHFASAAALFLTLAYFSICLFTKTGKTGTPTPRKMIRNRVYRACGYAMLFCIALIAVNAIALRNTIIAELKPVFWLESLALWAFGISWFIKGETLLRDRSGA